MRACVRSKPKRTRTRSDLIRSTRVRAITGIQQEIQDARRKLSTRLEFPDKLHINEPVLIEEYVCKIPEHVMETLFAILPARAHATQATRNTTIKNAGQKSIFK